VKDEERMYSKLAEAILHTMEGKTHEQKKLFFERLIGRMEMQHVAMLCVAFLMHEAFAEALFEPCEDCDCGAEEKAEKDSDCSTLPPHMHIIVNGHDISEFFKKVPGQESIGV
jgi:hypothetical protein